MIQADLRGLCACNEALLDYKGHHVLCNERIGDNTVNLDYHMFPEFSVQTYFYMARYILGMGSWNS